MLKGYSHITSENCYFTIFDRFGANSAQTFPAYTYTTYGMLGDLFTHLGMLILIYRRQEQSGTGLLYMFLKTVIM